MIDHVDRQLMRLLGTIAAALSTCAIALIVLAIAYVAVHA